MGFRVFRGRGERTLPTCRVDEWKCYWASLLTTAHTQYNKYTDCGADKLKVCTLLL